MKLVMIDIDLVVMTQMCYNIYDNLFKWLISQLRNQPNKLSLSMTLLDYTTCAGWRFRNWLLAGSFISAKRKRQNENNLYLWVI